jgi:peptidoglycan L-alanyl-D-glutamate endopeptidase CwlK
MPSFGLASKAQLATCHPRLQLVLNEAIKYFDFMVVEGHRGKEAQNAAFKAGLSKLQWPNGNHNATPSRAADIAPYPVDWKEGEKPHLRFAFMMGVVLVCAKQLGVKIRFGMDWNRNLDPRDESFMDLPHVELDE